MKDVVCSKGARCCELTVLTLEQNLAHRTNRSWPYWSNNDHTCSTVHVCIRCTYLGHVYDEKACHAGDNDHEHGKTISRINEEVYCQHQTKWGTNPHQDHDNVDWDANKAGVIDVVVLDIATLVGKEESKDHDKTLVYIKGTDEVAKVVTVALFINDYLIFSTLGLKWWGERREVGRRGDQGREKRVKRGKEETSILVLLAWKVPIKIHRGLH